MAVVLRIEWRVRGDCSSRTAREVDIASGTASIAGPPTAAKDGDIVKLDRSGMVDMMTTQLTPPIQTMTTPQPS